MFVICYFCAGAGQTLFKYSHSPLPPMTSFRNLFQQLADMGNHSSVDNIQTYITHYMYVLKCMELKSMLHAIYDIETICR